MKCIFKKILCQISHLYNDIHLAFAPAISHSELKFEAILLAKWSMCHYDNSKKKDEKHASDQGLQPLDFQIFQHYVP